MNRTCGKIAKIGSLLALLNKEPVIDGLELYIIIIMTLPSI